MVEFSPDTKVVILTGAGISAESGIKTFRASDGLWENHAIEDVATPYAWERDPELVWNFYQGRRSQLKEVEPNPAHQALVILEQYLGDNLLLVTQNVDDLHSRAGSKNLIHMHGELRILRCEECHETFDMMEKEHLTDQYVPCPSCSNQRLRPHIVWFHEMPFQLPEIYAAVEECDVFMTIGTSGHVYPAAGLIDVAKQSGALCVGVNLDEPMNYELHDEFHQGKAGELLPNLVNEWLS
ncbi:MAG TPA: NAD-dependent deacylase [Candidatus Poseidoniales archaeon]|nr:MAG TPA: NAD-dependent deacylase [Candidatus Poseidoniales archaeon]HII58545.1 NAD-dependent deacylase [Candidatus Poseidoniaceae archaeon]|tara:strand:- start:518 stop:1234 length:717 start_codon:yes stop_codon:yes gene_type:complete